MAVARICSVEPGGDVRAIARALPFVLRGVLPSDGRPRRNGSRQFEEAA